MLLALKSGELAADAIIEGLQTGDTSAAQLGALGRRRSTRASIACGGWSASITTASASATSSSNYPDLRNTVTDLLIGDLFTDKVDKVWKPMESLYPADKQRLMTWKEGMAPEQRAAQGQRARAARWAAAIASAPVLLVNAASSLPRPMPPAWCHFSVFFRYMEEAERRRLAARPALDIFREGTKTESAGLASPPKFDFKAPLEIPG